MTSPPIGILAGGGPLPLRLAQSVRASGQPVFVVRIKEFLDQTDYTDIPHAVLRLGAGGRIIELLRQHGVRRLVMTGAARRISPLAMMPDIWTAGMIARVGKAAIMGDDTVLRAVTTVLEAEGFEVVSVASLRADLLAVAGLLAGPAPDAMARHDIIRGIAILRAMAACDVGQSCAVQQGLVLGVEAIEGTDAMILRAGTLRRDGPGGVLVKLAKPQQDARLDMPTIGPVTVQNAIAAGLRGIAIEAGRTILADREQAFAAAQSAGLFIISIDPEAYSQENPS